jgi:hypothetical protein
VKQQACVLASKSEYYLREVQVMIKAILHIIVSVLVLIAMIVILGFLNAPGWFVDLGIAGEGILIILMLRGRRSRRSVGY